MSRFLPHRKVSFSEIVLIPEAFLYLFVFRLKVSYQPSRKWMPKETSENLEKIGAEKMGIALLIAKVINGLTTRTPWESTCLVKSLATNRMLQQRQINHKIHIGVARSLKNHLEAHAWLSVEDEVIVGGGNLENFQEIARLR